MRKLLAIFLPGIALSLVLTSCGPAADVPLDAADSTGIATSPGAAPPPASPVTAPLRKLRTR